MKTALVLGSSGFIGSALCSKLYDEGYWVRGVDIRWPYDLVGGCHDFQRADLRDYDKVIEIIRPPIPGIHRFDEVYALAADVGGAGYIFTGDHDAQVARNNLLINANVAKALAGGRHGPNCGSVLYTSSSCIYNDEFADASFGIDPAFRLDERDDRLAQPSNTYGWEKRFSEELWLAHKRNFGLDVRISRFSTIYGPGCGYHGGRENAVAAIIRKVLDAPDGGEVEVWGDGEQIRPLVYIDDLLAALTRLIRTRNFTGPVNISTDEFTTCNDIAREASRLSNKRLTVRYVPGPIGKKSLQMSTKLAKEELGWEATTPFSVGLERTFEWIAAQKAKAA